mmetsp:Transcript_36368/g.61487  ORF Transcript_36368/g.61487 Transcript_36368/m.61487 type:complete len:337 (+) Transcript_36368:44-1054(+)
MEVEAAKHGQATSILALRALGDPRIVRFIMQMLEGSWSLCRLHMACKAFKRSFGRFKFFHFAKKEMDTWKKNYSSNKCPKCWLLKEYCLCTYFAGVKAKVVQSHLQRYRVILFIHYREVARRLASNTARLIPLTFANVETYIYGLINSEYQLQERFQRIRMTNKGNCCVLFPDSKVARTSEQFLLSQRQQRRGLIESPGRRINSSMLNIDVVGSREESELGEAETNYTQDEQTRFTSNTAAAVSTAATTSRTATTIVVVDGTWKDARKMNLEIPNWIPRIKLSSSSRAKFINMRKHHVEGQVSTMSAFLHLLTEFGESEEVLKPLGDALDTAGKRL